MKFEIGAVVFRRDDKYQILMGTGRVNMLRRFYHQKDLGAYEPFVFGHGTITHDEVNWDTAGKRVTEDPRWKPEELKTLVGLYATHPCDQVCELGHKDHAVEDQGPCAIEVGVAQVEDACKGVKPMMSAIDKIFGIDTD